MTSEINQIIPAEIKYDQFYQAIKQIAKEEDIQTILEIGSSSGEGSTEAFVTGIRENPHHPQLFCMEISQARFTALQNRYAKDGFVKCYNVSSVGINKFAREKEVIDFYNSYQTALNQYPLERVLEWLRQDLKYLQDSRVSQAGIKQIKSENKIIFFDVVLIDGSEFTGEAELDEVYGAKFILLDDIHTFKNHKNYHRLLKDPNYKLLLHNLHLRNGYAIFQQEKFAFNEEQIEQRLVQRLVRQGMTVFDIGANIGNYSLLFSNLVGREGKVYSFEPTSTTFNTLKGRTENNQNIFVFQNAVFSENKLIQFNEFPDEFSVWNSIGRPQMKNPENPQEYVPIVKSETVSAITVDSFCQKHNIEKIDYLKIDVEGAESDVLNGCLNLLARKAIEFIQFEISQKMLEGMQHTAKETFDLLMANGYECHCIEKTGAIGGAVVNSKAFYENYIAFPSLPLHFFTIVLNGEPFIRYHIDVLKKLPFRWHWHIVEGVADLKHDTAWSVNLGGNISDDVHRDGRSLDGTTEYLDELARLYPQNISIYRKPEGEFWEGKREMINAPLSRISEECLLWQIDVDELWTFEQICQTRQMFIEHPEKTAAFYWCWYFVGENLVISTRNCYANNPQYEWLRTWRFKPGMVWATHEPPRLAEPLPNGKWRDVAFVNPFRHQETEKEGLVFQHFAYVTPNQLRFKEQYYGYKNATSQWLNLQQQTQFPVLLRQYFDWVNDESQVNSAIACGLEPLAQRDINTKRWQFKTTVSPLPALAVKPSQKSPTILIDGVFFQHNNTGIARVWKSLWQEWANTNFAQNIIILDRNGTAPKIPGIRYRTIPLYDYGDTDRDRAMLQQICDEEKADLFISTYYTTPISTPSVFMAYDMIPELMGQNIGHPEWREKHNGIRHAWAYITISENTARDLVKVFPHIPSSSVAVAHCGIDANFSPADREEISGFKSKYSITKPYFLLVGERVGWHGYKNGILFFKAFSQLANKFDFDIVCAGGKPILEPELELYCSGNTVHTLQLSDSELRAAYSGASVLVYPSKYEGFGLPVLEAMACGCPVITSPNGSIPEVAGQAAVYVNGDDVIGLVNALREIQKPNIRNSLIAAGLEQANKFSWSKMAATVSSLLLQVAERAHSENASVQQPTDPGLQGEFGNAENSQPVPSAFKVSAIVSTYNSEKFIRGCLQDLVEQMLYKQGQLEIIVIDSGSQENEQSVVREFQAKYPNIVYDRTSDRETLYAAWNRGIKMSHGAYITNANTDDRHRPDALEIMAKYLDENSTVSLVYADQLITNTANDTFATTQAEKRWNWPAFDYSELERRCIIGPQPMWKKSLHEKYGYFRTEFTAAGDYEFWLRIGKSENIVHLPEILGLYCENPQGLEHSSPISQQETRQIWDEYGIARRGVKPATTLPVSISPSQLNAMPYRTSAETLVSVIIPCYNHATLLREAVESVVSQTYSNWECIIVNDGSTDDTSNFGKYLIKLYPQKSLRLIDKPNTGPADSRNLGVEQSSGKFILFLDADDKLHPKFLEECVEILLAKPNVGFVYTDVQHFGSNCDLVVHGDFDANRFLRDNQAPATSLFRREIYEQVGGLKKVMKLGCEDWEFWVSAYEKGWLGDRLPKPYLYYRQHGDGSSRTQKMAGDRPKLDLMRATIIHLHSQLYKPEEVRWSQQILQQHGNLIANELVEFSKPEQFLTLLSQYVGEYQKDQANEVNLANIRQSRQQLANYWLNLPAEQLANAYGGDAGKAHQLLLKSNIKDEALTDAEKIVIDRLTAHLSQGIKTPKDINYLLAAALYRRADQLLLKYENAAIPNWFVNDYLKFMFAAPTLFQEIGEADNYCQYVQGWVSYLHSNIFKNPNSQVWQDIAWFFTQIANFIPLYFNSRNLKDIYTKRADIIEYAVKNRGAAIDCIFPARSANRQKIRLGVLTKHFGAMTETFATLPAFEYLNREQFEIILYALNLDGNKLEQYCQSRADRLVKLSNDLPSQVQAIRADDLDILLIATNITAVTHPISLLALHRLARVQTTCFNSPVTTGIRHIDYYIAGKLMEPVPEGQEHYREELATIDGPGCCFSYTLEPYTPNINFTRNSIGISEESVVFISSANLYKLLPELRETWAKIIAAVPNSVLFLMPFGPSWTNHYPGGAFVNNMKAVFAKYGIESNRLRVLKSFPNRADVKEVLKLGDVYLDSYPYAGTTSLVDPLEVGLPTVVRDGDTLRSRMGAAVVRSLSIPDLIANSEASYIQLAVSLGTNPQLRQQKRQEIQQKMQANPACFDSVAYSGAIGKLFQELFGKWQTSHLEASRSLQDSIPKQTDLGEMLSNALKLYQRNSSNISAISELRQIRKQIADFWLNVPTENLETAYKSASGNSYQILLKSDFQRQPMMESEQMFLQQLTQISKGLVHPKAVNALLAAMLYFPPETMRIPDARNRLPHWLIGDYEQVFESEAAVKYDSTSDLLAQYIQSPQFVNQLLGCVNLYRIDPSDESVVLELRQIRKQMADFWLTVPSEKLENFYRGQVRKGYQAILSCGLQAESMTEVEQQFLHKLTEMSKGLVQPQAINALLGAMLYFVPGKMRVPDARTRLPQWLLEDYEKVFDSAFATTEQTVVKQDYMPQFLNELTAAVNLYEIDPTAELVIADLRQIRKQIADVWLSVSGEQVEVLYRSNFGKGYKALLGSGFINEPQNESERAFFKSLVVELSKGFGTPQAVNNLLAAMLYCRAGQLRVQDANTCLPPWLLEDYEQLAGGAVKVAVG
ncbi:MULTISPECIES: FkbM family methyltransferase [unclassified Microcoleus]|uniref:FkbM family methyltransferase n=1 Tax=unclassified Microcoleus TaxID=2642155 RepID=UPI002FD50C65